MCATATLALGLPSFRAAPNSLFLPILSLFLPLIHPFVTPPFLALFLIVFRHCDALLAAALTIMNHYIDWKGFLPFYGY